MSHRMLLHADKCDGAGARPAQQRDIVRVFVYMPAARHQVRFLLHVCCLICVWLDMCVLIAAV